MAIWNERLGEARKKSGLSLLQLSDKLGVSEATAQRYESGANQNIPPKILEKYAEVFNVSTAYLMGYEPSKEIVKVMMNVMEDEHLFQLSKIMKSMNEKEKKQLVKYAELMLSLQDDI